MSNCSVRNDESSFVSEMIRMSILLPISICESNLFLKEFKSNWAHIKLFTFFSLRYLSILFGCSFWWTFSILYSPFHSHAFRFRFSVFRFTVMPSVFDFPFQSCLPFSVFGFPFHSHAFVFGFPFHSHAFSFWFSVFRFTVMPSVFGC